MNIVNTFKYVVKFAERERDFISAMNRRSSSEEWCISSKAAGPKVFAYLYGSSDFGFNSYVGIGDKLLFVWGEELDLSAFTVLTQDKKENLI